MAKAPVLIVDDAPANLKVARVALESDGFVVRTAADGEEAWRVLAEFEPRVILMDLQLPGVDGFELTRRIKADPTRQSIRVIAVTAYAMKGDREKALAAGCDGYISKPIDPILLPGLIGSHLADVAAQATEPNSNARAALLVVEDNPTTRKLIRVALESEGHRVQEAPDARSAVDWLERNAARLIIQDLVLPDMDGLELVQRLRELPNARQVPILCLSGFLARMDAAKALEGGFSALLVKPVDPIQLLETVRGHLESVRPHIGSESPAVGPHVLVIDDDPLQRRLAEYHLMSAGFRVTVISDARRALELALQAQPDAIVSDILMRDMDGFELCLNVRSKPPLAATPVILISSHFTEAADVKLAEQVGANALIARSGDWSGVLRSVREALAAASPPRVLVDSNAARDAILRRTQAQLERQMRSNASLSQQCLLQAAQLSVLAGVSDALARDTKLNGVLGDVLAVCLDLAGISKGALYLRDADEYVPRHWIGFSTAEIARLAGFFGCKEVLERVEPTAIMTIPSATIAPDTSQLFLQNAGINAALVVPVAWGDRLYGALLIGARSADVTEQEAAAFARVLGRQMGQAIGLADTFERLHSSEQKFRALVDSMERVTVVDAQQHIVAMYGRGLERDHLDPNVLVGKPVDDVLGSVDHELHRHAHARAFSGDSFVYEWSRVDGGATRHYQAALSPIRDPQGQVVSVVRVGGEITEQKRMQAQIMVSDRMASVGMLAAGVAHEINNPLMAALGNIEIALESMADDAPGDDGSGANGIREALKDALDAAQRVEVIVRDLRLFSRAEEEHLSSIDVRAILDSTLRMARNEIRHRARLIKDYRELPLVRGNGSRLGQVFLNLLINAAQAIAEGRADSNEIRVHAYTDPAGRAVVEIHDTGCGIPPSLAEKLFTPFTTTKPVGIGTGLGLAICQRIVQGMAGEITFDSEVGRGTTFRVVLPADSAPFKSLPASPALVKPNRRGRVLVIDDDAALGTLMHKTLSQEHDVVCMADARQALQQVVLGEQFDVILCDLMMPVMTGAEFHAALTKTSPEHAQRIVFLTGGAFTPGARDFMERARQPVLDKPCDLTKLRSLINARLQ